MIFANFFANVRRNRSEALADLVNKSMPNVHSGTLRFWGAWFGRPADNNHHIVSAESDDLKTKIHFDEGETLTIWNPKRFWVSSRIFRIGFADRLRFEWFLYGRARTSENLRFIDYVLNGNKIDASTDFPDRNYDQTVSGSPSVEISG